MTATASAVTAPQQDLGPDEDLALQRDPAPPPDAAAVRPSRRALLGLLATAGATAAAAHLTGRVVDEVAAGPSRLDPASALRITVTGLTTGVDRAAGAAAHGAHSTAPDVPDGTTTDALGARVWSRLVTVALVVRNTAAADVLFSPGQVRLRLVDGTSVMPVDSERPAGALAGLSTTRTWVRFLAPQDAGALSVDYTPAGATEPVVLPVGGHGDEGAR